MKYKQKVLSHGLSLLIATAALFGAAGPLLAQEKKPNIVTLMTDDTGWNSGGQDRSHAIHRVTRYRSSRKAREDQENRGSRREAKEA